MELTMSAELVEQYRLQIEPLLPLAKRAYGSRFQNTPAHKASREYTRLLCEYYEQGGSLPDLAKALKVAYPGVRRRVVMENVSITQIKPHKKAHKSEVPAAVERIKNAKQNGGVEAYHAQIAEEYKNGFSLQDLAKGLGLSSAAPLYYGAQRSLQKGN
jgi:predicted peroxiredoxin